MAASWKGFRWARRISSLSLILVLFFTSLPIAGAEQAAIYSWPAVPSGTIGIARPDIQMKVTFPGLSLSGYQMKVNHQSVPVSYHSQTSSFLYTPPTNLAAGAYSVELVLQFKGYLPKTYSWSFVVKAETVQTASIDSTPSSDREEAMKAVNQLRSSLGLSPVIWNDKLNRTASSHADYLAVNQTVSHEEVPGKPQFFGRSLSDRIAYYGYANVRVYEDISMQPNGTASTAVAELYAAPYHRIPFLDPSVKEIGYARSGSYHVLLFGAESPSASPQLVVSPMGKDVAPDWEGHEVPDPLRLHPGMSYPIGYPIVASVHGENVVRVIPVEGTLKQDSGEVVPLRTNSSEQDAFVSNEVLFLPETSLKANARYQAKIVLEAVFKDGSRKTYTKQWTFETGKSGEGQTGGSVVNGNASGKVRFQIGAAVYENGTSRFPMSAKPLLQNGAAYLPLRDLGAALGAKVSWNAAAQEATFERKGLTVRIPVGRLIGSVNGKPVLVQTKALLIDGRVQVPVRVLAGLLGCRIDYEAANQTITVTLPSGF
ncbi:stalk domain-containing protein [Gorillibacterium sp. CAU 1737]|uniref:stalk domain-containing protein n=1 Tax=Gorillibacterium sp. CAU 1737 TaxID=3140362 RepID=UPI00325FFFC6